MSKNLPQGWKRVKLGDVVKLEGGYAFKSSEFVENQLPIIRIGNITEKGIELDYSVCYTSDFQQVDKYKIINGDILIAMSGATTGKLAMYNVDTLALLNQRVGRFSILDRRLLNNKFLMYILKSKNVQRKIIFMASGCAQPNISGKQLESIEFNLPPLKEQERIVSILERAEGAISKREECNRLLDELVKSRFIELFGSPATNPMGWNIDVIGSVVKSITAGWSANGEVREKRENEKAVLKVSAVTQGYFKPNEYKVIDNSVEIKKYIYPQKGDLLFSRANTREMVGATCIIHKDYPDLLLPDKLWKVLFNDRVNVFYMKYILSESSIRAKFSASSTGTSGSMYNVSMDKFKCIEIPIPPIELQNQFEYFTKQVDKLKFEMQSSLEELQNNFNSLMQRAFNGEL